MPREFTSGPAERETAVRGLRHRGSPTEMERLYFAGMLVLATYGGFFAVLPPVYLGVYRDENGFCPPRRPAARRAGFGTST